MSDMTPDCTDRCYGEACVHRQAAVLRADWFKPITMEVEFQSVDPEVLGILTGGVMGTKPEPTFSLEVHTPIKRTFWQWLLRRPKQYQRIYIPNARLTTGDTDAQDRD